MLETNMGTIVVPPHVSDVASLFSELALPVDTVAGYIRAEVGPGG